MTQGNIEAAELSVKNRKKAYSAMCKATILLFVFSFLSMAVTEGLVWLLGEYNLFLQKIIIYVVRIFGVDNGVARIAVRSLMSSDAFYEFLQMFVSVFTMVIPAYVFARCAHLDQDECFNVKGRCIKGIVPMIGLCQMVMTFVLTFSGIVMSVFISPVFNVDISMSSAVPSGFHPIEFLIIVISNSVLVPVIEEYMFRGVVFSYLRRYGTVYAVVASSLLFGIAHPSPEQSVFAFAFGLLSAFTVVVTGNIKTGIILHAANNLVYVIESYTFGTAADSILRAINILLFGLGFAGIYYMLRNGGYMDVFRQNTSEIDKKAVFLPGLREVVTLPGVVYILLYAIGFVSEMMV